MRQRGMPHARQASRAGNTILHRQHSGRRGVRHRRPRLLGRNEKKRHRPDVAVRGQVRRLDRRLPRATLLRKNAGVGQWLLRHRDYDPIACEREPDERRFLPWRVRNVHMQCGHLEQRHQRDMHSHAGGERQMRHHHRLRRGHARERNRDGEPVAVELRGQLRRHDSSVPRHQVVVRFDLRLVGIRHGHRVGWHAALHLHLGGVGREHGRKLFGRCEHHLLVLGPRVADSSLGERRGEGLCRIDWLGLFHFGWPAGSLKRL